MNPECLQPLLEGKMEMTTASQKPETSNHAETANDRPGFTPGPWCIEDPMAPESLWIVQAGKQTYEWWPIAVCNMPDEEDHLFTGAEVNANATLIAAAPALYKALKTLADECEAEFTLDGKWVDDAQLVSRKAFRDARAALALATGASS